jgi:hypothetical protein
LLIMRSRDVDMVVTGTAMSISCGVGSGPVQSAPPVPGSQIRIDAVVPTSVLRRTAENRRGRPITVIV